MKTIMITGTTNGIGKVTALELARAGHRLIMANRNREASEALRDNLVRDTGNEQIELIDLDLSSLASVASCAEAFLAEHKALDLLINNAGLMSMDEVITDDGFELQFEVNALAQLGLTLALMPALESAAPAQVIFVTSMMHKFGKLDYASFRGWQKYSGGASYNQSKLAMMLLARELAEQSLDKNISVTTLHPGAVNTGILDTYSPLAQVFLRKMFVSPEKGARTTLYLADRDDPMADSRKYFVNAKEARPNKLVEDVAARQRLWDTCVEFLNAG